VEYHPHVHMGTNATDESMTDTGGVNPQSFMDLGGLLPLSSFLLSISYLYPFCLSHLTYLTHTFVVLMAFSFTLCLHYLQQITSLNLLFICKPCPKCTK
jgi:hypothetical protein